VNASLSASGSNGGRGSGVSIKSQVTVDGRADLRPASLDSAEDIRRSASQGSEEHPASRRLNSGAVAGAVRWLWPAGV
jgi:hypothetical protein